MGKNSTSKFISLILRHKPETIGITLDEHGWANVDELIEGVNKTHPKSRLYVHLSGDVETAVKVGRRHGKPVVYRVLAERMAEAGMVFFKSVNGVWLTKAVPPEFLRLESLEDFGITIS